MNTNTANTTNTSSLGDTIQNMLNGMPGNQLPVLILTHVPMMGKQSFSVANMVPTTGKRRGRPKGSIARVKAVLGKTGRGPGRPPKNTVVTAKRGPGRPKKNDVVATETRKVGRPRKNEAAKPAKRGPGRPKKVATEVVA